MSAKAASHSGRQQLERERIGRLQAEEKVLKVSLGGHPPGEDSDDAPGAIVFARGWQLAMAGLSRTWNTKALAPR